MVGVPGKSKGCIATNSSQTVPYVSEAGGAVKARRTGIHGCDSRVLVIELGYAKYPTFLNKTVDGPEKRYGLEEAKPRQSFTSADLPIESKVLPIRLQGPALVQQPSPGILFDTQLLSHFFQSWVPIENFTQVDGNRLWLQQVMLIADPPFALNLSIKALACTRLGWRSHDKALATRGSMLYGQALYELQKALWDERLMWLDEILAAAYVLSIYELFETTNSSIKGWNSHLSGLNNLVRLRGPRRHQSSLGRAVLESYRFSSMIQSIQFRQTSFHVEETDWREVPWKGHGKDVLQGLCDCGFELGRLQHRMDDAGLQNGDLSRGEAENFLRDVNERQLELDATYQKVLSSSTSSIFWVGDKSFQTVSETVMSTLLGSDHESIPDSFTFPSLRIATAVITYWALKIVAAATALQLWNEIRQSSSSSAGPSSNQPDSDDIRKARYRRDQAIPGAITSQQPRPDLSQHQSLPPEASFLNPPALEASTADTIENNPIILATNILRAMPFCLSDKQGMLGTQQTLFPLRVALFILRIHPGTELRCCQRIYEAMHERKGLRYAKEIGKVDGGHGVRGNERSIAVTPRVRPTQRSEVQPYTVAKAGESVETSPN